MVDDDDDNESPFLEPRMDSRSALQREIRAWRRLRVVKHDETFSLIFFLPKTEYMELELRSEEVQGAHEIGGRALGGAPPCLVGPLRLPRPQLELHMFRLAEKKIREKGSSRFTIRSRRQALISLGRADLESVRGSGEGDSSPSSSPTILHHQFHDAHRRA